MWSGAKMPFSASASAIMFAIVLRYAIGNWLFASTSSTDMPCDCFGPQRRSSSRTMSLPLTQDWSVPPNTTRRACEDEVVVGDRSLPREDRVPAGDLVERVDRERRCAVRGRQQVGVDAQRGAARDAGRFVDAMRPDDLLGRRHRAGTLGIGPL